MATGDVTDLVRRLRAALPRRWFPETAEDSPVLTGVLTGAASVWANLYTLLVYVRQQTRIGTASGVFLDIIAKDFFQTRITRFLSESDNHFRRRILIEILRPRATRAAVAQALTDLTGTPPVIFEPANTSDTGGYNVGGVGYNTAGGYGDLLLPFQAFITAFRPAGGGVANVSGYGNVAIGVELTGGLGGYGQGAIEWADMEMVQGAITDSDIYATVAATLPAAAIGWTRGLAASPSQTLQVSRPVGGFSRVTSAARGSIALVAGALVTALGRAKSMGQLGSFNASTSGLAGSGLSLGTGTLIPQAGAMIARGVSALTGRTGVLTGAGILRGRTLGALKGRSAQLVGTTLLTARGIGQSAGNFLSGVVVVLPGRATALARGAATIAAAAAMITRGKAKGSGVAVAGLTGGASLVTRGTGRSAGRFTTAALAANMSAIGRSGGKGKSTVALQQAAPTAPSNVVASNATPNTMTLTWSPSTGAP